MLDGHTKQCTAAPSTAFFFNWTAGSALVESRIACSMIQAVQDARWPNWELYLPFDLVLKKKRKRGMAMATLAAPVATALIQAVILVY